MSFLCATLTPSVAWMTVDSLFYTGGAGIMDEMAARLAVTDDAGVARSSAARVFEPVKTYGAADKIVTIPQRSLAMMSAGAAAPFGVLAAGAYEAQASFDELLADLPALWRALPVDLQALPMMMVAMGYSDVRSRMCGLIALSSEELSPRDLEDGHMMQPCPDPAAPGYAAIESKWSLAAVGLDVSLFHDLVARSCAGSFPDRIGGPIRHCKLTRRGTETCTLATIDAAAA